MHPDQTVIRGRGPKLTAPQRAVLRHVADGEMLSPAALDKLFDLERLGLIEQVSGGAGVVRLRITDTGREALRALEARAG